MPWLLLSSSLERPGVYSRAATIRGQCLLCICSVLVICQNSGCGQSKRTRAADNRFDEAVASQVEEMFCLDSVVHEHHVYKMIWTPFLGEILTSISEPESNHNRHAVCGHIPHELFSSASLCFFHPRILFSSTPCNRATALLEML